MADTPAPLRITHGQAIEAVEIVQALAYHAQTGGLAAELHLDRAVITQIVDLAKRIEKQ